MNVLALETTETAASLAALRDYNLLLEIDLDSKRRSAQSLVPGVRELLGRVGWRTSDLDLVAVGIGPGSFTGVRVGVTTAKVLAYAAGAEVLGVESPAAIAAAVPGEVEDLSVVLDAQRGQLVTQRFHRRPDRRLVAEQPWQLTAIDAWLGGLRPGVAVAGPILRRLADRLPDHVRLLEPTFWCPRAATIGRLAIDDYALGRRDDLWKLLPIYFRRSAAEEKLDQSAG
jgi:tRNA threonylcarbamoyladenosine biosynthesis protein TsaB